MKISAYMLERMKSALATTGEHLPARSMYALESTYNYLSVGQWMKVRGYRSDWRFGSRNEAFLRAASGIRSQRVLYLEFGVWKGESTRFWSKLLTNPASALHGFDSFEGLPEDWSSTYRKGAFSVNGKLPVIDDPRVRFFKGLFEQTLSRYQPPDHDVMFINCDADLYSSTKTVLKYVGLLLKPGDYLYFDEFHHANDERRAFDEFLLTSGFRFSLVGCSGPRSQLLFVRD
jgi:Macrocin-O-methyltransferase (TylF)